MSTEPLKVLDLFSGIGGFSLGLERAGMETVAFCEYDKKAQLVLKKHWPDIPIYDDVRTLTGEQLEKDGIGDIGLICGGFPCQDISLAGAGAGLDGERSGLWGEYERLISEIRPSIVIIENVTALLVRGFDRVVCDLSSLGYCVRWDCIPAHYVGSPQNRDRIWIVAHTDGEVLERLTYTGSPEKVWQERAQQLGAMAKALIQFCQPSGSFGGITYAVPGRMDRLKQLGNAVVPQIPEIIGRAIMQDKPL